jgi:protocatechuate 3,4-dioxygenase alpha subunit
VALPPTPSQTVGPFFHIGLPDERADLFTNQLVSPEDPDAVRIHGVVLDAQGAPVNDALLEIWQANRHGRYAHPEDAREDVPLEEGFLGFGRCGTDDEGRYEFVTVKPGRVPAPGGRLQAPHIEMSVFARGLLKRLATRIYFPDEAEANEEDPVLSGLEPDARATLVASEEDGTLRFDVRLQGENETAFFAV